MISILFYLLLIIHISKQEPKHSSPLINGDKSKYINFKLTHLNSTFNVRVHLSLQLETHSPDTTTTTTTTASLRDHTRGTRSYNNNNNSEKTFTINDAIEAFRKDLIEKEINIGGIIESSTVFFRHFNLKYDNCEIRLRCSYYSNYQYRKLNIYLPNLIPNFIEMYYILMVEEQEKSSRQAHYLNDHKMI
ncbi:hypothetical protein FF38_06083 [Lucilia cuprina]|uniref:SEA domain-containing protein n=1 Tax=Lucilia cuprina TaxID=7375 RepID=A0A0L0CM08_LUCCU|nr:hypothetical protein FF38_06083 [Lucilia cuprina]